MDDLSEASLQRAGQVWDETDLMPTTMMQRGEDCRHRANSISPMGVTKKDSVDGLGYR